MNRHSLFHVTDFEYDGPVSESYNEVRLRPRQDETQTCLSFQLSTRPAARTAYFVDPYDNWVYRFNVLGEHRHLRIEAESVVLVHEPAALPAEGPRLSEIGEHSEALEEFYDLLCPSVYVPHLPQARDLAAEAERESDGSIAGFARAATTLVHNRFRYEKGATHVQSSIEDVLGTGAGVCQDFSHLLLAMVRMRGLPGRYVSGYLMPEATNEVVGGQASHAWIEIYLPGEGWFGLDPTLGQQVDIHHVRVAYGRDYGDVAPVRGVYKGHAGQRLSVDVRVRPAFDEGGRDILQNTAAGPAEPPPSEELPQQQQQQQ
jgi:transglutaminase-like putative cysteine protease